MHLWQRGFQLVYVYDNLIVSELIRATYYMMIISYHTINISYDDYVIPYYYHIIWWLYHTVNILYDDHVIPLTYHMMITSYHAINLLYYMIIILCHCVMSYDGHFILHYYINLSYNYYVISKSVELGVEFWLRWKSYMYTFSFQSLFMFQ